MSIELPFLFADKHDRACAEFHSRVDRDALFLELLHDSDVQGPDRYDRVSVGVVLYGVRAYTTVGQLKWLVGKLAAGWTFESTEAV